MCKHLRVDAGLIVRHVQRVTVAIGVAETIPSVEIALDAAGGSDTMEREMPQGVHLAECVHSVAPEFRVAYGVPVVWLSGPETLCVPMQNAPGYAEIAAVAGSVEDVTRSDAGETGVVELAVAVNSAASVGLARSVRMQDGQCSARSVTLVQDTAAIQRNTVTHILT